jgi:hypothetical protein
VEGSDRRHAGPFQQLPSVGSRTQQTRASEKQKSPSNASKTKNKRRGQKKKDKQARPAQQAKVAISLVSDDQLRKSRISSLPSTLETNISRLAMGKTKAVAQFIAAAVNPAHNIARFPDAVSSRTKVWQSRQFIDVFVKNDTTDPASAGFFSAAFRPILGQTSGSPESNKVSLAVNNPFAGPATPFSNANSYALLVGTENIRIDPNQAQLTAPPPGNAWITATVATANNPFSNATLVGQSYGINPTFRNVGGQFEVTVPPGQYRFVASSDSAFSTAQFVFTPVGNATVVAEGSIGAAATAFELSMLVTIPDGSSKVLIGQTSTGGATVANLYITPVQTQSLTAPLDFGVLKMVRPTAMTVLFTCDLPDLNNGGRIAGAVVPGSTLDDSYYVDNAQAPGNLHFTSSVARCNGARDGRLQDGCYAIWAPNTVEEMNFRSPSEMNAYDFTSIVVSGQYSFPAGTAANALVSIGRFLVINNWEGQFTTPLFEGESCIGSVGEASECITALSLMPRVMENDEHEGFFAKVRQALQKVYGFYTDNSAWINPMASAAARLGLSIL